MIAVFDKNVLLNSLIPAMSTVSGKNTIPTLEGIHLKCTLDNRCAIESYDLEKGLRTFCECEVEREGSCIINAQRLLQIIKVMPEGPIKITVESSHKTIIESGLSYFDIKSLPGSDFPTLPLLDTDKGFMISQRLFKKYINRVLFAVKPDDARPVFGGAYFQIRGDKIIVVACDGNRLAYCENDMEIKNKNRDGTSLNLNFIIPGKTLVEILKLIKDVDDEIEIRVLRRYVVLRIGNITLFSKTIDADYIDYARLLPKTSNIEFTLKGEELRSALERSSLIVEDRLAGAIRSYVKFTIDEILSISTMSPNGNVYDELQIDKIKGEALTIAFECRILLESLRVCNNGEMKLSFNSPLAGVLIEPASDEDGKYMYFVMPKRIIN